MPDDKRPTEPREPIVCVIVNGWPRISTTFIAQELVGLEREGLRLWLATYGPSDKISHSLHRQLQATVHPLGDPFRQPLRLLRAWMKVRRLPGYAKARSIFREENAGGVTRRRLRSFARSILLAADLPADTGLIYAQFISAAATIGRYAAAIRGLPIAGSAHARDIWMAPDREKKAKLDAMDWCTTCTTSGAEHLAALSGEAGKVRLVHHGLLLDRFPDDMPSHSKRDGSDPDSPVRILSVGRAIEKKGFDDLLAALAGLPNEIHWRWQHIGEGRLLASLQEAARTLGVDDRIQWLGAQDQAAVIARYRESDLFVLPSREGSDKDRDGLPNVLMEAQSQGVCCLSTDFSAIPELIEDGTTGVLVPPGDRAALGAALLRLVQSPESRARLGRAGRDRVRGHFRAETGINEVARLIRGSLKDGSPR
jgi:glycosyltransferase involved in cell wall biosynthesis